MDLTALLQTALQSHQGGDFIAARAGYDAVLQQDPDNINALHLLGVLENQTGNPTAAIQLIGRAVELLPAFGEAHNSLGNVYKDQENWAAATECYDRAIAADPDLAGAHLNRGLVARQAGDTQTALAHYDNALAIDPNFVAAHFNRGNALMELGRAAEAVAAYRETLAGDADFPEARGNLAGALREVGNQNLEAGQWQAAATAYEEALEIGPDSRAVRNNLGNALRNLGQTENAIEQFGKALVVDPDYAAAHNSLGNILEDLGQPQRAIESYQRALAATPDFTAALNNMGNALRAIDQADAAIEHYARALVVDPDFLDAHFNLGHAHKEAGAFTEAEACYRRVLELAPDHGGAYRHLASMNALPEGGEALGVILELLGRDNLADMERAELAFAAGKAFDDAGDAERSFDMYLAGNAAKRRTFAYDPADDAALFQRIQSVFTSSLFDGGANSGDDDPAPIFIVGMPRSGTSLVEQILASHPHVHGAGELMVMTEIAGDCGHPDTVAGFAADDLQRLGARYITRVRGHAGDAPRITDKMPHNFLYLGLIRLILPSARIIHCTRAPEATCLSLFKTLFTDRLDFAYDLRELGAYWGLYANLMAHWQSVLPGGLFEISYEALVTDQRTETQRLLKYLDLPWDDACLSFHRSARRVTTASNVQVRRPMYADAVDGWRKYERLLGPLFEALPSAPDGS